MKNDVNRLIFSMYFDGLGRRIQEKEYENILFLFGWEFSWSVITNDHSDSSYSLIKMILYLPPEFYEL